MFFQSVIRNAGIYTYVDNDHHERCECVRKSSFLILNLYFVQAVARFTFQICFQYASFSFICAEHGQFWDG